MLRSVLIANRGEIACRVARTAKRLGMHTIAVYSEADAGALHTRSCDEAYPIGGPEPRASYLAIDHLIAAAKQAGADCIHPGYGFLSENADFADACAQAGLVFVGPPAGAIRAMGLKDRAKTLMQRAGVPVVPGYHGERQDAKFLKEKAYQIGYPVLIKPAAGGGGRGLRRVDKHADFDAALEGAVRESQSAFGSGRILIEKFIASPRHIEIQVFADKHGNAIHLGERDCSLQRRHQKVIEEAPAPGMTSELRTAIGKAAVAAAKAVDYCGAGTVEFVADGTAGLRGDAIWFIEMNTRLQVEHPVTEQITGLDLVEWQFRIAAGEELPLRQDDIRFNGHAIEARIYAEDPEHDFLPSTGTIVALEFPDMVRIDSGVEAGGDVPPFYDPMIAKLIAHAPNRDGALDRLTQSLDRTVIAGVQTNVPLLASLCRAPAFRDGKVDTGFVDRNLAALGAAPREPDWAAAASGAAYLLGAAAIAPQGETAQEKDAGLEEYSPWSARDGFQLGGRRQISLPIVIDGEDAEAVIDYGGAGPRLTVHGVEPAAAARLFHSGAQAYALHSGRQTRVHIKDFAASGAEADGGDNVIKAPMHGRVLALFAVVGERVMPGQRLAVIEAMKMEHTLRAPFAAMVKELPVSTGAQVVEGAPIMVLEPTEVLETSSP
jgi:3-methylcrotonyl-CoA carboxylase alpha subunit